MCNRESEGTDLNELLENLDFNDYNKEKEQVVYEAEVEIDNSLEEIEQNIVEEEEKTTQEQVQAELIDKAEDKSVKRAKILAGLGVKKVVGLTLAFFSLIACFVFFITNPFGCTWGNNEDISVVDRPDAIPLIEESQESLVDTREGFQETTQTITEQAEEGREKTPQEVKSTLDVYWGKILKAAAIQLGLIDKLEENEGRLNRAKAKVSELEAFAQAETERAEKEKQRADKAEEEATKSLKAKYIWISIACFAGLVLCIALLFTGHKLAMYGAIACGAGLGLSIFLITTMDLIPWIVGGVIVIAAGLVIWQFIRKNKTIKEVVQTAETSKPLMDKDSRKIVYGYESVPGLAAQIQSKSTQEEVDRIRKRMKYTATSLEEKENREFVEKEVGALEDIKKKLIDLDDLKSDFDLLKKEQEKQRYAITDFLERDSI